jgi:hypothetical protein
VLIVETWIKPSEKQFFNLQNYQSLHSIRPNLIGGGASIFILKDFDTANIVYEESSNNNNYIIVSLIKSDIHVGLCYRQPNNAIDTDGKLFLNKLDLLLNTYSKIYFFGDMNINIFDRNASLVSNYIDIISSNGKVLLNSTDEQFPTRINQRFHTSTCIDHIITDIHYFKNDLIHEMYMFDNIADHKNIILSIKSQAKISEQPKPIQLKQVNNLKIINSNLLGNMNCDSFDDLTNRIGNVISENTSYKKTQLQCIKPFINRITREFIEIRNKFINLKAKYPHCSEIRTRFKYYRNLVNRLVKKSKKEYFDRKFKENLDNPRKTWQNINSILYNKPHNPDTSCSSLVENGISVTNPNAIADHLNNFFINISNLIASNVKTSDIHTTFSDHNIPSYQISHNFICPAVTEDETKIIIANLKPSSAVDFYGLSNNFVKMHANALIPNLTQLMNNNLFAGCFPDSLKVIIVTPVYKSGDRKDKNNYRPISVSPILGKVYEYAIQRRLQDHLDKNKIINSCQFGFVKNSNTEIAVIHMLHDIYNSIDNKKAVSLTCIDLSKAFDSIRHDILINKLKSLQLDKFFFNILVSYLNDRKQAVKVGDAVSSFKTVKDGTPQGGILSNPFFNLFINDIFDLPLYGKMSLYADDMSLVNEGDDPVDLKMKIEHDLNLIMNWLIRNCLIPNESKTKYILFHNKKKFENFTEQSLNIQFNGKTLERVESLQVLGLLIDESLSFKNHIQATRDKIIAFSYAIKRARNLISDKTAIALYFAHVQSRIMYMNTVWSAAAQYNMNALEVAQRKSLRILLRKDWFCSKSELYSNKILPLSVLCKISTCINVFKILSNKLKCNVTIQTANQIHHHRTRMRGNFVIPVTQTQLGSQTFFIRGLILYNSLDQTIKNFNSLNIFKSRLKEFFYDIYCDDNNYN